MTRSLTSIKLDKTTRDRLKSHKVGDETYNQLIDKMIDQYEPEVTAQ